MHFRSLEISPVLRELFVTLVVGITAFLDGLTYMFDVNEVISADVNKNIKNMADFVNTFSRIIGCLFFTQISNFFGRKISILLIYLMYLFTFLFITLNSSSAFLTSYILAGIANGGKSVVILYIGEISKTERRISFIFLLSFLWTFGYFVIILAQNQIPVLFTIIIICLISLTGFLMTCFIPESKYWYATHRDYENTRASILWFNEEQVPANTAKEIDEITEIREDKTDNSGDFYARVKYTGIEQFSYSLLLLFLCTTCNRAMNLIFLPKFREMYEILGLLDTLEVKSACYLGMSVIALIVVGRFKRKTLASWICISLIILFLALLATDSNYEMIFVPPKWLELFVVLILNAIMNSLLLPLATVLTVEIITKSNKKRCSILGLLYSVMYLWQGICLPNLSVISIELGWITLACIFIVGIVLIFILVKIRIPETWNKALHYCLSP